MEIINLIQTTFELGLISSLTVLALFLSYKILNVCDLSTDGCFTLGACVGAIVALSGHPILSIPAAMCAGILSGFIVASLQTYFGIDSLLAGIIVNTGLYSINIFTMGGKSLLNMNKTTTIFTMTKDVLPKNIQDKYILIVALIAVILVIIFLFFFLRTRLGLALRATGDNQDMVRSSSINTKTMIIIGLCISNSFTALSGCLLAQSQKSVNIDMGTGMVTIALASLLIGNAFYNKNKILNRLIFAVVGSIIFRLVYLVALRLNMPAFMLKLVSAIIVIIAIAGPYLKEKRIHRNRKLRPNEKGGANNA